MALRPGGTWGNVGFVCARHASDADLPIPPEVTFRRVRLIVQVDFAGVSWRSDEAVAEAQARLERAVADAGGLMLSTGGCSAIVRHVADDAAPGLARVGGRPGGR